MNGVLQLIDSLHPGGAERVAVSYANTLASIGTSHLGATREEGGLKNQIEPAVGYLFLNKRSSIDLKSLRRLIRYCRVNQIAIIHAHGSSFLTATLACFFLKNTQIIWHNHFGNIRQMSTFYLRVLRWCSQYFSAILTVNEELKLWSEVFLKTDRVLYFKNAVDFQEKDNLNTVELPGNPSFRILMVANFRKEKDHMNALRAFKSVQAEIPEATLHLIGMHTDTDILESVNDFINEQGLTQSVFIHGSQQDVKAFMHSCSIGLLSSRSEGLPMTLLEYGAMRLPIVCTAVGQCPQVLGASGYLVPPQDAKALSIALLKALTTDNAEQTAAFYARVKSEYSIQAIIPKLVEFYESVH